MDLKAGSRHEQDMYNGYTNNVSNIKTFIYIDTSGNFMGIILRQISSAFLYLQFSVLHVFFCIFHISAQYHKNNICTDNT
jgi:hypothetical protein